MLLTISYKKFNLNNVYENELYNIWFDRKNELNNSFANERLFSLSRDPYIHQGITDVHIILRQSWTY